MNWFLIINDTECRSALANFVANNADSILYKGESHKVFNNIDRVLTNLDRKLKKGSRIAINAAQIITVLRVDDIIRCESHRSYTEVYSRGGAKLTVSKTLKQFEAELREYNFVRIHHSHLVNLDFVEKYVKSKGGHLVLTDGTELPVATRKKEELLRELECLK